MLIPFHLEVCLFGCDFLGEKGSFGLRVFIMAEIHSWFDHLFLISTGDIGKCS